MRRECAFPMFYSEDNTEFGFSLPCLLELPSFRLPNFSAGPRQSHQMSCPLIFFSLLVHTVHTGRILFYFYIITYSKGFLLLRVKIHTQPGFYFVREILSAALGLAMRPAPLSWSTSQPSLNSCLSLHPVTWFSGQGLRPGWKQGPVVGYGPSSGRREELTGR